MRPCATKARARPPGGLAARAARGKGATQPAAVLADPLNPSPEQIRAMGEEVVRWIASYYGELDTLSVFPGTSSAALRSALDRDLPVEGTDFNAVLDVVRDVIFASSRHNGHPRFFGYVASPGTAATAFADLLASALNANVTSWRSAPGPTEIERLSLDWIKQIVGFPASGEGVFVSGGSVANLCGIAAARQARAPGNVTAEGCHTLTRPMRLYISDEGHFSVPKAAGLLGIGRDNVRAIRTDERLRLDVDALVRAVEEDFAAGYLPFCVVGSAGAVGTGAVDPLDEIADVAAGFGLWMHVDASYGGFAALAPSRQPLFRGMERADSVALDPHKWLYLPLDCGCILYRNPNAARAAFAEDAEYTRVIKQGGGESLAFWDYTPELSRRFRALKVWTMLRHVGTRALGEAVERNIACAQYLARLVDESPDFEMLAPAELSIFCFRNVPPQLRAEREAADAPRRQEIEQYLDEFNEQIMVVVQKNGRSYLSNAHVRGRFALRGCVMNYRTSEHDMEVLLDDCRRAAEEVLRV